MTNDLEEFQKTHGPQWAKILRMSSFNAGMIYLSVQLMERIRGLSDDEISRNSVVLLSDLRGRLLHESELISLPVPEEPIGTGDIQENYPDAVEELWKETQRQNNQPTP